LVFKRWTRAGVFDPDGKKVDFMDANELRSIVIRLDRYKPVRLTADTLSEFGGSQLADG